MSPGNTSVILLVVIALCGSNLLCIQNMNIITIVFKVGLIFFSFILLALLKNRYNNPNIDFSFGIHPMIFR